MTRDSIASFSRFNKRVVTGELQRFSSLNGHFSLSMLRLQPLETRSFRPPAENKKRFMQKSSNACRL
ncbi:hypothetical protein [Fictibacillus sp. S7]|uniref:hypothetical protein n=1 Tax=Fictibacillus sp. S7 TaxID=2212476 RepID=UPI0019D6EEF3|nr:hypothetical protein [Fictibacillus sp. S7]